jgi:uncharacterized protein (UPF0332 family)
LNASGYHDFSTSRAYYAVFYAATALLLGADLESSKHSGVLALIHQHFVKTGRLDSTHGKAMNWLFELRGVADYGVTEHVSSAQAEEAVTSAEAFLAAAKLLLDTPRLRE